MEILNCLNKNRRVLLSALALIVVCILFFVALNYFHHAKPVTFTSQQQAEQPQAIKKAANDAHMPINDQQAIEVAERIQTIVRANEKPVETIYTDGENLQEVVKAEQVKSGADFSIVTNPKEPTKQVDVKELEKTNPAVTLNQYNVQAYKKTMHDVTIYPKANGVSEINFGVSKKITNNGVYLGMVTGYDFDNKKAKIGLRVTY